MIQVTDQRWMSLSRRRLLAIAALAAPVSLRLRAEAASDPSVTTTADGVFLNPEIVHSVSLGYEQGVYDAMIQTYIESGDKDWMEASVTIDGEVYEHAGIRLKGNSSLMRLRMSPDGDAPADAETNGPRMGSSAENPERLPWLIRLDKYLDDQNHEGMTQLVIRANNSQTALNEAVSLLLLAEAGLASQLAAYTAFQVGEGTPVLRLAIENPKDAWMKTHFSKDGLLYKSEATGDWSYRGEDPASYTDVFELEAGGSGDDDDDIKPLTSLLDFLNNSDDEAFVAELPERLDLPRFATYLAMMDLIENPDDIDGPGNNSYLYCAPDTGQFTVVPWDMNLAFGGMRSALDGGPATTPPNGGNVAIMPGPGGTPAAAPVTIWEDNGDMDPSASPVAGGGFSTDGPQMNVVGQGGPGGITNPLVKRFNAVAEFSAMTEAASEELEASLFASGVANAILDGWVAVLETGATALIDAETISSEAETLRELFPTA